MRAVLTASLLLAAATATLAQESPPRFTPLFNGKDYSGWEFVNCSEKNWPIKEGALTTNGGNLPGAGWLVSERQYEDFELRLEFLVQGKGTVSAVAVRAGPVPQEGAIRVLIRGDGAGTLQTDKGIQPSEKAAKPPGQWNDLHVKAIGRKLTVTLNGTVIHDADLDALVQQYRGYQGMRRPAGYIGLQCYGGVAHYRNLQIKPLNERSNVGKVTLTLDRGGLPFPVGGVFFTGDSKHLITYAADRCVRIWDVGTGELTRVVRLPGRGERYQVDLSPDGKTLAVGGTYLEGDTNHAVIHLLNMPDGKLRHVLTGHREALLHLKFAGNGLLYSSAEDHSIRVWDPATGKQTGLLSSGLGWSWPGDAWRDYVGALAVSPKGDRLLLNQEEVSLFAIEGMSLKPLVKLMGTGMSLVVMSPDGKSIATSGQATVVDKKVLNTGFHLFDADGKELEQPEGLKFSKAAVFGTGKAEGQLLVVHNSSAHQANLVDTKTGKAVTQFVPKADNLRGFPSPGFAFAGALSPDGKLAATAGGRVGAGEAYIWRTADGEIVHRLSGTNWLANQNTAWSEDGTRVAWGAGTQYHALDLTKLELAPVPVGEKLLGPSLKEGALTLENQEPSARYWERQVVKDGKVIARVGVPHRSHVPQAGTFVGPERVALSGDYGGFFLHDAATGKRLREFKLSDGQRGYCPFMASIAPSPAKARYLATLSADQLLRIWNPERERPLLTLFVDGRDWIVWTEEGYYAATPGGERLIGWQVDNGIDKMPSFYPAERFRKQLYRPDVIKLVLEKGSVEEALKAANAALPKEERPKTDIPAKLDELLPPVVILTAGKPNDKNEVTFTVSAKAGVKEQPIASLRLFVDGRPFAGVPAATFEKGVPAYQKDWPVTLSPGKHEVAVLARSADASALSNTLEVDCTPAKDKPVLHVLAIGINEYKDEDLKLACAVNDANLIAKTFKTACEGNLFHKVEARPLLNKEATSVEVVQALQNLRTNAKAGDLVVVFFAGHGAKEKDRFYLLTHEADVGALEKTALSGAKLRDELKEFPCQVLLMLDACHAAGFGEKGKLSKRNLKPATDDATRTFTDDEVGVAVMCAAMGYEKAAEQNQNGLFTRRLAEALTLKDKVPHNYANQRQYVHHLHAYVFDAVVADSNNKQHPFLHLPWVVESFPVRTLSGK